MNQEKTGAFIAELRKEKSLTQAQLAERFGLSNKAVSKWETGKSCCLERNLKPGIIFNRHWDDSIRRSHLRILCS